MSDAWNGIVEILRRERLLAACSLNQGAAPEDISGLEAHLGVEFPESLKAFLLVRNGQSENARLGLYFGASLLSVQGIRIQWDTWRSIDEPAMNADCAEFMSSEPVGVIKPLYSNRCWIPLTHDHGGNHVGLDFDPDTDGTYGQVIAFGRDEDQKTLLANSHAEFLADFVAKLGSADWSFASDLRQPQNDAASSENPWWKLW